MQVSSASGLQRRAVIFLRYDFDIQYHKTTEFGQADALSRLISLQLVADDDTVITDMEKDDDFQLYPSNSSD